ncbi:alpha-amylase family glycosyl hydrolase [Paraferrimonas sp. SM1919]|uniref:alpha-amylase family glycosyl hydrolase n=1 Tax=Paraferrimonas sp. SM1919 TaxID=2662263 RepID=UPI0013D27392|nr:alpha-amylase family glycosyl hydrolase [Paraferrimonas sp. SM1919]
MKKFTLAPLAALILMGCGETTADNESAVEFYGTKHPFAKESVYFLMTDRFVDGDKSNNHETQGGEFGNATHTFNRELKGPDGKTANVGYLGGDYQGVLNNADYIADMGFTSIWLTPIWDNPDEAFTGGTPIEFGGMFKDGGKTGYHGYWGVNFFKEDEHWVSEGLGFKEYSQTLRDKHGIKTIMDIVANHGSPSFTMESQQPKFGKIFDQDGTLIADHQNVMPQDLDDNNPMHDFFNRKKDIAELSDFNQDNPAVVDYLTRAYLHWIDQGADAFRVDTIKHMPHHFWKQISDNIRAEHPDFFMFGESFDYNANFIAQHTLEKNGAYSVLDFPLKEQMLKTFENKDSDFADLAPALHLTHGPYRNVYELTTFYDNHDMARMNADDNGFIDAHNLLFTARGIPVVYYGSEMGFMRGTGEHAGNRNYFGQDNVELAAQHQIHAKLSRIANLRKVTPTLQSGVQLNLEFSGDKASFLRVLGTKDNAEVSLVLLNKGDIAAEFSVADLPQGRWQSLLSDDGMGIKGELKATVAPHDVQVWHYQGVLTDSLTEKLAYQMENK